MQDLNKALQQSVIAARIALLQKKWSVAEHHYVESQELLGQLVSRQLTRRFKELVIGRYLDVAQMLAWVRIKLNNLPGALDALEGGRARLITEMLDVRVVRSAVLRSHGYELEADELDRALARLHQVEGTLTNPSSGILHGNSDELRHARDSLQSTLARLEPLSNDKKIGTVGWEGVWDHLPTGTLVIYVEPGREHAYAIMVSRSGNVLRYLPFPDLAKDLLHKRVKMFVDAYKCKCNDPGEWLDTLDRTCRWLWDAVMYPILQEAKSLPQIEALIMIPCGAFAVMPLHAAWREEPQSIGGRKYAMDEILISYAPNARSLTRSRQWQSPLILDTTAVIAAVRTPGEDDLPFAEEEAHAVREALPRATILTDPSRELALDAMRNASLIHFACHAKIRDHPLASCILFPNGHALALHELLRESFQSARLVTLSACETARVGHDLPDEYVGLGSTFLAAGVSGVIGSLWSVADRSTAMLMGELYAQLAERSRGSRSTSIAPAEALRAAQVWLRDATSADLGVWPADDAGGVRRDVISPAHPFAHPYYWAAFVYMGT